MKRALLFALAAVVITAIGLFLSDFYDPAPVETPTKTCEPIGAQHPKTDTVECKQS